MLNYWGIDQIVSTTHDTVNLLAKNKAGWDALLLYFRYIQQKKMQENVNTFSTDKFMKKAMWFWDHRFKKAKRLLKDLWLIEIISSKDEDWKFDKRYIKINFVISSSSKKNHSVENPPSGKSETNTLVTKENTLVTKENTVSSKKEEDDLEYLFEKFWSRYPIKKWKAKAKQHFLVATKKNSYDNIMQWLVNYIQDTETKRKQKVFVPEYAHASTRINQERRNDEYETKTKSDDELVKEMDDLKNSDLAKKATQIFKEKYWEETMRKIYYKRRDMVTDRALSN